MENNYWIDFDKKCFCFTGDLIELSRKEAENEVNLRNGQTTDRITSQLDYLIVGSKPNPRWKYGDYGNKIHAALSFRAKNGKPLIIQGFDFMDALSLNFPVKEVHLREKFIVIKYTFYDSMENAEYLNQLFIEIAKAFNLIFDIEQTVYNEFYLFDNFKNELSIEEIKYEFILIQLVPEGLNLTSTIDAIKQNLIANSVLSDQLLIREIKEGTSSFRRYFQKYCP